MRIIMLGTGAALPDPERCHSSIVLTLDNGRHFLIDCGHGATRQLMRVDVNPADVSHLLLTHLHHDHVCEFPFFVISGWILGRVGALDVRGPAGTSVSRATYSRVAPSMPISGRAPPIPCARRTWKRSAPA